MSLELAKDMKSILLQLMIVLTTLNDMVSKKIQHYVRLKGIVGVS